MDQSCLHLKCYVANYITMSSNEYPPFVTESFISLHLARSKPSAVSVVSVVHLQAEKQDSTNLHFPCAEQVFAAVPSVATSDHKPVFARFCVSIAPPISVRAHNTAAVVSQSQRCVGVLRNLCYTCAVSEVYGSALSLELSSPSSLLFGRDQEDSNKPHTYTLSTKALARTKSMHTTTAERRKPKKTTARRKCCGGKDSTEAITAEAVATVRTWEKLHGAFHDVSFSESLEFELKGVKSIETLRADVYDGVDKDSGDTKNVEFAESLTIRLSDGHNSASSHVPKNPKS
eukprot:SAG31_NODE_337_length_17493_cov_5.855755_2_plen_288_part_00